MLKDAVIEDNKHYVIIKRAVSQETCRLLADYANFKARTKPNIRKNRDPLYDIHREYGDPLIEMLFEQLTPVMEQATGLKLWPTLSFYYTYKKGNQLNPHKDRSSCQWVAGLCIGADDAYQQSEGSWPLILEVNGKPESITLEFGDILMFKGHETTHWREPFRGEWFISAIFGFVEKEGPFAFQKYDQRASLGKPHVGMFHWLFGCIKHHVRSWFVSTPRST